MVPMAADAEPGQFSSTDDAAKRAEEDFVAGVISRGEAAKLGENGELPEGATHEIIEDENGRRLVRRRFSAF
jgi:hypothetical protein